MTDSRWIAKLDFSGVRMEVWINDIPVAMITPPDGSPMAIPVNQYIIRGNNRLSVVIHAGPLASRASEPWRNEGAALGYNGPAVVRAQIALYETGETALGTTKNAQAVVEWAGEAEPLPFRLAEVFSVDSPPGPSAWQNGERFHNIDSAIRAQAVTYLESLQALLRAGRFEAFAAENGTKIAEFEIAYGLPHDSMRGELLDELNSRSGPLFVLEEIDPAAIDLRLVAGNRMIECLRADRRHVLEYSNPTDGDVFFIPTIVGRIGGSWSVLR